MSVIDRFRLDGRVAIVTGASSGLGVTLAQTLAEAGADIVLAARRVDGLKATAASIEELGRRAHVVPADVGVREDCERVVAEAYDAFGRLDVLVNNAGTGRVTPALKEEPDEFERVLRVNLSGSHFTACAAARRMEPGASIVNIASVLAFTSGGIPQAAYTASKAGVVGLTRDLAGQWTSRRGIRVNAVAPGFFKTEMTEHDLDDADHLSRRIMIGRLGDPAELASAVVFLASDASSYVTGATLTVDGGFTAS